jgi:8-oxo-dGTP diphosphatase
MKSPRFRSAAIVIHDNNILLMQRKNRSGEYYAFPGGGVEEGETPEMAAVREVMEETCISIELGPLAYRIIWDDGAENFFYLGTYKSGEPRLSPDTVEMEAVLYRDQFYNPVWIPLVQLPSLRLYQLEVRDLLINDAKDGFTACKTAPRELHIKMSERRS